MDAGKDNEGLMADDQELDFGEQDNLLLDELDLPEDGSFILDEPLETVADNEQALAGVPEPPSLDDLDLDVAQGAALRSDDTSDDDSLIQESPATTTGERPWEDEILSSEELPSEEPEIEEIDSLLGSDTDSPDESGDLSDIDLSEEDTGATDTEEIHLSDLPDEIIADDDTPDLLDAELDDLEIPESDEAIPPSDNEDITAPALEQESADEYSAAEDTEFDSEELPDITEDEDALDLDEGEFDLLHSGNEAAPPAAPTQDTEAIFEREMEGAPSSHDFFAESEDEEILLSDEELEDITSEAPKPAKPAADDFFSDDSEEEIALSEEELDGIMEDAVPEPAATPTEEAESLEPSAPGDDFFADNGDDEPVSLSADELEGIMEDAVPEESAALNDTTAPAATEIADDFFSEDEDNEPITLSPDELDGILEDAAEDTSAGEPTEMLLEDIDHKPAIEIEEEPLTAEESGQSPLAPSFEEDEDDITLSADELNGILEDVDVPEEGEDSFQIQESELAEDLASSSEEEMDLSPESDGSDFFKEEDEGPITLSDEELDGILADSGTEPEDGVGMEPLPETDMSSFQDEDSVEPTLKDDSEAVVLTENLDNASLDSADARAAAIEEMSEGALPPREELRKMIAYLDNLLGELPDDTIAKFAQSEYFKLYQKVMEQLDL